MIAAILGFVSNIISKLKVPPADAVTDTSMRDVVGKKDDTANTTVGTTSSLMRYVKALLNQMATVIVNIAAVQSDLDNPSQYKSDATLAKQNAIIADTQDIQSTLATPATFKSDATLAKQDAIIADTENIQSKLLTKGVAFTLVFPILTTSNALITGAAGLDSEISKEGGAFADCTNEATEIGATGMYTLALIAADMNADYIMIKVTTTTANAMNPLIVIYTTA